MVLAGFTGCMSSELEQAWRKRERGNVKISAERSKTNHDLSIKRMYTVNLMVSTDVLRENAWDFEEISLHLIAFAEQASVRACCVITL